MIEECEVCRSNLYLTLKDDLWCPKCNGITPLSKDESLILCESLLKDINDDIDFYCSCFSFESLLYAGTESREIKIKDFKEGLYYSWDIKNVIWNTFLIKRALEGPCGEEDIYNKTFLTPLFQSFYDILSLNNDKILIEEEYGDFFEYSDVNNIEETPYLSSENGRSYVFIPNVTWSRYLKNLEEGNFSRKSELENVAKKSLTRNTAATLEERRMRLFEIINNSFHHACYDQELFAFNEIDYEDEEVLEFFKDIEDLALSRAKFLIKTSVVKISKDKFFEIANKYNYGSNELFNMFISSKSNIKEFPILIEDKEEIILCPETIFLIRLILENKFNTTIIDGYQFEDEVELQLQSLGYKTDDPRHSGKHLRGRKIKIVDPDSGEEKEREIDIIAYKDSQMLIIECKEWRLNPKLLWKHQQQYRVKDIIEEIDKKHLDRVKFVKDNYKDRFGFNNDYEVKGLIVTKLKENINMCKNIRIISRNELDEI